MKNKNKKLLTIIFIVIAIVFAIASYKLLPEQVAIQVDFSRNPTTVVYKLIAITLAFGLTSVGALLNYFNDTNNQKYIILTVVGYLISIVTLIMN